MIRKQAVLMGSVFEITIVDKDSTTVLQHIDKALSEIFRIEYLISEWKPETPVSEVNRQAGIRPVVVDRELFELTKRALIYSEMSDGAFDISTASMDRIWRFDGSMSEMPTSEAISRSIEDVNYRNIILDSVQSSIFLKNKGMRIGFGSIGKSYSADKARELMISMSVPAGIINASGDIVTWGRPPGKRNWVIGIADPFEPHNMLKKLKMNSGSIATSGSYEKYVEFDGVRYSHIIDPTTGYPAIGITSVTVSGPSAEVANALSTSIMVLGKEKGKKLMKLCRCYKAVIVKDK